MWTLHADDVNTSLFVENLLDPWTKSVKVRLSFLQPTSGHLIIQLGRYFSFVLDTPVRSVVCKNCTNFMSRCIIT